MDIELLRTFLEVARLRHFGQAAEALSLTQAAVSARIKNLEGQLGVSLFDREKREIRLTPAGNRLTGHADRLIMQWRKTRQEVTAGGAARQLSVGGSLRLWDVLLQDWLLRLRRRSPGIAMIAESHTPEVLIRKLLDGVLDLAFMLEPAQLDVLQIREVATVELILVSDREDTSLDEALGDGYLMVDWGLAHALMHRRMFPDAPEPHTRLGNSHMALSYLHALGGAAYLPRSMLHERLDAGLLHRVNGAPVIRHAAHAVFRLRGPRQDLIDDVLGLFHDRG
ncbi:MAG: LysR family transcriptional regulator [Gammaproteobacteria bacterium]|nr:LysR family transcriptional regulator [Gammaproteobacteria bacterium]MCP5435822.1 LysR family transcriptional regulator [Chromatiaceae bacterium]MCW5587586.1 LysR family transcriptional regulator [Chromatiales bacterium]MCB1819633.1 LysR family transcriptional regulator [Gammaproteobacteria bacterium]HOP16036.1 LysR family transcriptional regulator [Gammaproteobacteria bacterium]